MKGMFESGEIFASYAEIDYCYYWLGQCKKEMDKPRDPLSIMVDKATGYRSAKLEETRKTIVSLLKCIIKNKKLIGADYSQDEIALKELKNLKISS